MLATRRPLALVLGAALLSAVACSDSTGPRGSLTSAEITELARQMGVGLTGAFSPSAALANIGEASQNAGPEPLKVEISINVPCPVSGVTKLTATVTGDVDNSTQTANVKAHGTNEPDHCGFDVHGKTVWVTGLLTSDAEAHVLNGLPVGVQTASLKGRFSWETSDHRSGSCTVDYSATANYTTHRVVVDGSFCGSMIRIDAPLTN